MALVKRLNKEDFPQQYQDLIGKIGYILNPALTQLTSVFSRGLSITDLNTQSKDLVFNVDGNGNFGSISFQSTLNGKCGAIYIGRIQNLTTPANYINNVPLISFTTDGDNIIINNISGLANNTKYQIRILATT